MSVLPDGWANVSLAQAVEPDAPIIYGILQPGPDKADGVPYVRPTEIVDDAIDVSALRRTSREIAERYGRSSLEPGDVLLSIVGTIGKVAVVPEELAGGNITQSSCRIRARRAATSTHFVSHFLRSPSARSQFEEARLGTAVPRLNLEDVRKIEMPLPPLPEQRRIVAKIDSLTGKSRRARDHLDHIPRLVEKYNQAVLAAAFRGELTRCWRLENEAQIDIEATRQERAASVLDRRRARALAELPRRGTFEHLIPSTWRWTSIEELASDEPRSIQSGPFGSALLHSEFVSQGRLVIGIDNVQDGYFDKGSENRITDAKFTELARFAARPNDVLITVMATIGRVCVLPTDLEPAIITKHVYRITVDGRCALPEFIALGLRGSEAALSHMGANVRGQTRPGLNGEIIKSLFLPMPPLREQCEIVRLIKSAFAWIDRVASEATSARGMIDRLDQSVLAKAFRGELVPQDPTDEPAGVLLERIRTERGTTNRARRGRKARASA